jgi:light-regulated signal transduction histidine kinase (bacteriophytochrome)
MPLDVDSGANNFSTREADGGKGRARDCENEPIRIPGSIQRHGFLLLLDEENKHVVAASQNAEEFLEVPLALILGTPVENVLEREVLGALQAQANYDDQPGSQTYLGSFQVRGMFYSVVTHLVGRERILEFERVDRLIKPEMTSQVFTNFVSKLNSLQTDLELCQVLTKQVRNLTGFNRTLLYRFDDLGHGTVLCEESDGVLPSYLDLRFPASDIPQQARDLYVLNTVRIIPDAMYVPSPLRGLNQGAIGNLDLSMSILRSVSLVHLEYMRNMGTASSMSISIVLDGKLWGLVSGHHAVPHMVPYVVRSACDLLTKLVGTQLTSFRRSASLQKLLQFHVVQRRILTRVAAANNYLLEIGNQIEDLIHLTDAGGVALVTEGDCKISGKAPEEPAVRRLARWMDDNPEFEVFESRELGKDIAWAEPMRTFASGLLAIRISRVPRSYLMWFRPEVVQTVKWAGEPIKLVDKDKSLNPRKSFEIWKELVRGRSDAWTETEVESATDFSGAVMAISLRRAEEAMQLGEARFLQLTNELPHPVWTCDDDGHTTYVNQKWLDQGLDDAGRWYEQKRMVAEDRDRCGPAWQASVEEGKPFEIELRFRAPSEDMIRWNLVRAVPYLRTNGSRAGWAGTCTDLTDRRQREAALKVAEKLTLSGRMTSVIAHEINNPLEALINLLYLLNDRIGDDEFSREYLASAQGELQRISGITKQTLRWSQPSADMPGYGSVGTLFRDVVQLFAAKIENKNIDIVIEGGEDVRFYGAINQLEQVLASIVSNAIQAVSVGGNIWLSSRTDGEMMEIIVRDEGCGMSEETLGNLFQPFYSTKGDLGNGLGLYISNEIVQRHGGSLIVKSREGTGTEIRMRLPALGPGALPGKASTKIGPHAQPIRGRTNSATDTGLSSLTK